MQFNNLEEEPVSSGQPRYGRRIVITVAVIALLLVAVFLMLILRTYDSVQVLETHELSDAGNNGYTPFAGKILKYNRDGIALMDTDGEDEWNQPVQMAQPSAAVSGKYAAVADLSGTDVCVVNEKGKAVQIRTSRPIERIAVGGDGTTAVIQENGSTPVISCFNNEGTLILKHQASLSESGYPICAAISDDGEVLAVSYLQAGSSGVSGKISYFDIRSKKKDNQLYTKNLEDEAAGEIFFMDDMSAVVGESQCTLYEGTGKPAVKKTISFEGEIEKVFHDGEYFGFVERLPSGDRRLSVYAKNGSQKLDETILGSYEKVVFADKQIILFSGQEGCIYTLRGFHRFQGQLKDNTLFVLPVGGLNRYAVITNEGLNTVSLTR